MATTTPFCPTLPREKIPNDGMGPRGFPDCYYVSRTLNSTFRYARFVKKLRLAEEEQRKGRENNLKALKDQQISDFFIRCDRKSLINNVARRVDLCMRSYQRDLEAKKERLKALYAQEEESNIRAVVTQAQAAAKTLWQEKLDRLQYLLDKRRKEHHDKYKDTPISKCSHVQPCLVALRNKEAQEFQLYQMREKESMKMQEREFDKMWHEVGMKESEALAARMEIDAIDRFRRDMECKQHSDMILAQREKQRAIDRERLKREQLELKAQFDADMKKEAEEEAARQAKRMQTALDRKQTIEERKALLARQAEKDDMIEELWESLSHQGLADEQKKKDLIRKKEQDLDDCNRKLIEMKQQLNESINNDAVVDGMAREQQELIDRKRCDYLLRSQKQSRDVRKAIVDQIQERAKDREDLKKKIALEDEYHRQLHNQLAQLLGNKAMEDAQDRKRHQQDLLKQIEYNKLLKERALQEEMDQRKKAAIATREYQDEINQMLCRPSYSEEVHPFMRQMRRLDKMQETCPCSKPTWCKNSEEHQKKLYLPIIIRRYHRQTD